MNCCWRLMPPCMEAVDGETVTIIGCAARFTVAGPLIVPFDWLVAVMVRACPLKMLAGAVYRPACDSVPTPVGVTDHVTVWLQLLKSTAANCWAWETLSK